MMADSATLEDIRAAIVAELDRLTAAGKALAAGETPPIDALDQRVAALCRIAEALPRDDARALAPDLERLLAALDELAAEIWSAVRRGKGGRIFPFQLGRP